MRHRVQTPVPPKKKKKKKKKLQAGKTWMAEAPEDRCKNMAPRGRGWAQLGLSHPCLFLLQNKLRQKLTIMYSHINGASRALEDVRAKQQSVRVSGSTPSGPSPVLAFPLASRQDRLGSDLHKPGCVTCAKKLCTQERPFPNPN
jgi:hypothetical protein